MRSDTGKIYRVSNIRSLTEQVNRLIVAIESGGSASDCVEIEHPSFELPSIPGFPADKYDLEQLRDKVLVALNSVRDKSEEEKDRILATTLYEAIDLVPAQSGDGLLWQTLASFLLPDIVVARFGISESSIRGRVGGNRRNALYRLWFRRHALSAELEEAFSDILSQDLVQQIVERPSIASDRRIVGEILRAISEFQFSGNTNRQFYREALKEVTLLGGIAVPQAMSDSELKKTLDSRFEVIAERIRTFEAR